MKMIRFIKKLPIKVLNRLKSFYTKLSFYLFYSKVVHSYSPDIFEGKTVAIIGGADSVYAEEKGSYIDSFDIVIRINRGVDSDFLKSEYLGSRTDILFHGLNENKIGGSGEVRPIEWKKRGVKSVVYPYPFYKYNIYDYAVRSRGVLPLFIISEEDFTEAKKDLKSQPTTGFLAIYMLLKSNYKKVYISGFTFFKTPHRKEYNVGVEHSQIMEVINKVSLEFRHNPEYEFEWVKKIYKTSKNIEVDKVMKSLFENN